MRCRAYFLPDGSVHVVHPAPKARLDGETDEALLSRVCGDTSECKAGYPFIDLDPSELPDRKFRGKWRSSPDGSGIVVDHSVKTDEERRQEAKERRVQKLMALGLTKEEAES